MTAKRLMFMALALAAFCGYARGADAVPPIADALPPIADALPPIADDDVARLLAAIKPQPGESPWRDIPWLTNVTEARRRAIAEDKPIVIFTAADGSPLSRT